MCSRSSWLHMRCKGCVLAGAALALASPCAFGSSPPSAAFTPSSAGRLEHKRSAGCYTRWSGSKRRPCRTFMAASPLPDLTHEDIGRYSRHLILPEVGMQGQRQLKASSVLCVGTGGLGSPLLLYLAAAGIGRIGIVDDDVVDLSNLQRQVIHGESTLGKPKVHSAKARIQDVNPSVQVDAIQDRISIDNVMKLLEPYDLVVDGSDNFPTRFLVNDACVMLGKPLVYGAILRFEGQASVFNYQGGPNYRDLLAQPPPPGAVPSCAEGGVFGVLPGVIGCIQATEVIKLLTGIGEPLSGRLLIYDALTMRFREMALNKREDAPPITELVDYDARCPDVVLAEGVDARAEVEEGPTFQGVSVKEAKERLAKGWAPFVLDVRMATEADIVSLPFTDRLCAHREVERIVSELPRGTDILVYCKGGARSKQACATLAKAGFDRVFDLEGGIKAWAEQIDRRMPVY